MTTNTIMHDPATLHPSLWLASQLARAGSECVDTGFPALSKQLPGGGWPLGGLVELLLAQPGIGELRLLRPALQQLASQRIALLQPPHAPHAAGFAALGIAPQHLLWLRSKKQGDALWAAQQILQSASCGALLFWQSQIKSESLRRLHLAAQQSQSLFCLLRPLSVARDASPAILRLALRPAPFGLRIEFIKRRGPLRETPLFLPLPACLGIVDRHVTLDRIAPAPVSARSVLPALVGVR
ncbi:MAG: translesion DNA synthesis-associated protein ImuA [Burkholderiales bacterium]|nr:translesion DNA synthesis-associated protein ImuA [Burkholderiales bacterium]